MRRDLILQSKVDGIGIRIKKASVFFIIIIFCVASLLSFILKNNNGFFTKTNFENAEWTETKSYTTIDEIPDNLKKAVVVIEDKRFYWHSGIDIISIGRAFCKNIRAGEIVEGGSTITQQLAKNIFLSNERTFERKFKEVFYTIALENMYTKDQILEMYLNVIYYGENTYGVENASKRYFNKELKDLSLAECAMLAGIPQAPSLYNPEENYDMAKERQEIVLSVMAQNNLIDELAEKEAQNQNLLIAVQD